MKYLLLFLSALFTLVFSPTAAAQKIEKQTLTSGGNQRTYYLYVPSKPKAGVAMPLIVTLHGSGRDGRSLVEKWKDFAEKEGIIVAGPDSKNSAQWSLGEDGLDLFFDLVESLRSKLPVDSRRVYLFGHSAGAGYALILSLFESRYFAATAVHAGALNSSSHGYMERAPRKTPIAIFVGTRDHLFPLSAVRATRDALKERGFPAELTEINGHDHWYYNRADQINQGAWTFLSRHSLAEVPH